MQISHLSADFRSLSELIQPTFEYAANFLKSLRASGRLVDAGRRPLQRRARQSGGGKDLRLLGHPQHGRERFRQLDGATPGRSANRRPVTTCLRASNLARTASLPASLAQPVKQQRVHEPDPTRLIAAAMRSEVRFDKPAINCCDAMCNGKYPLRFGFMGFPFNTPSMLTRDVEGVTFKNRSRGPSPIGVTVHLTVSGRGSPGFATNAVVGAIVKPDDESSNEVFLSSCFHS